MIDVPGQVQGGMAIQAMGRGGPQGEGVDDFRRSIEVANLMSEDQLEAALE